MALYDDTTIRCLVSDCFNYCARLAEDLKSEAVANAIRKAGAATTFEVGDTETQVIFNATVRR